MFSRYTRVLYVLALALVPRPCFCGPLNPTNQTDDYTASLSNEPPKIKPIREPDFLECERVYGEDIPMPKCEKAFEFMLSGNQKITFTTSKETGQGRDVIEVPMQYPDDRDNPTCVITVDLAGKSEKKNYVKIRKNSLKDLYRHVNNSCITDNFGRAGFVTYHLKDTVAGMAKLKPTPDGLIDVPMFLTLLISKAETAYQRKRPGNTDPKVNEKIQAGLERMKRDGEWKSPKVEEVDNVISALIETKHHMNVGGDQAFWDPGRITAMVPDNVRYLCHDYGDRMPKKRNCEDLSYTFLGKNSILMKPDKLIERQRGNCKITISTRQENPVKLDLLRATINVLLVKCVDGVGAPGYGGTAQAPEIDVSDSWTGTTNHSQSPTGLGLNASPSPRPPEPWPWKLPPTVAIWVKYARPNPICGSLSTINGIEVCDTSRLPSLDGPPIPGIEVHSTNTTATNLPPPADASSLLPGSNGPTPTTGLLSSFSLTPGGGIDPAVGALPNSETS